MLHQKRRSGAVAERLFRSRLRAPVQERGAFLDPAVTMRPVLGSPALSFTVASGYPLDFPRAGYIFVRIALGALQAES